MQLSLQNWTNTKKIASSFVLGLPTGLTCWTPVSNSRCLPCWKGNEVGSDYWVFSFALDSALLRPGRLDRLVYLGVSQSEQRKVLAAQIRKLRLEGSADDIASQVAKSLPSGLTGADLSTVASGGLLRATQRLCEEADRELEILHSSGDTHASLAKVLSSWTEDRVVPMVTLGDLIAAAKAVVPSVTVEEMEKYEMLRRKFSTQS